MDASNLTATPTTFWENAYRQNINKMIGVSYRYTLHRQIAEDLAHDAFIIAYEKASSYKGSGPFEAWLRRIVVNVCLQYIRGQRKQKYMTDWMPPDADTLPVQDENIQQPYADLTEAALLQVIHQLPEHHQLVFNLYVVDQFTHAEIATQLGISEGTSKSHLARARKKIKTLLQQQLNGEQKQHKNNASFLLFWKADSLYKKSFTNFQLPCTRPHAFNKLLHHPSTIPVIKAPVSLLTKWSAGSIAAGIVSTLVIAVLPPGKNDRNKIIAAHAIDQKNYVADTATNTKKAILFSENDIVNKKTGNMKQLPTMGALLLAGSSLTMSANAQITPKASTETVTRVSASPRAAVSATGGVTSTVSAGVQVSPAVNTTTMSIGGGVQPTTAGAATIMSVGEGPAIDIASGVDMSGSFYAERLRWSADDELHFDGKSVIKFGKNNFINNGTVIFLGKVHYLVINGKPVTLQERDKTIKLAEKKYDLVQLSPATAEKKYGEPGKQGAIEISLAE